MVIILSGCLGLFNIANTTLLLTTMKRIRNPKMIALSGKVKLGLLVVGAVLLLVLVLRARRPSQVAAPAQQAAENTQIASTTVDQSFYFPALNAQAEEDGEVNLLIKDAQLTSEIIVQGKPAQARNHKVFLVINLEIENSDTESKFVKPTDWIRMLGDDGKKYAPDVHSGVVEVQPISTKITRVAFVVPEGKRQFSLLVGELKGEKQSVTLNFE